MKMISVTYLSVFCLAYAAAVEQPDENGTTLPPELEDVARRELTDDGYVIRHGSELYRYPMVILPFIRPIRPSEINQPETLVQENEIDNTEEDKGRPLFYFTTSEAADDQPAGLPKSRPYIEIRKKRDVDIAEVPESSKVGKLRMKRTYCRKCGGGYRGGGGGYYVPVTYAVYPVYYGGGGGGGGGKGCYTCGGGHGGGGGGGGGGSYSYSSSSAQSSSGSFGWGKK